MIQDFLSTSIQLTTPAASVLFLVQFFRFSAQRSSISVYVHSAPSSPAAPALQSLIAAPNSSLTPASQQGYSSLCTFRLADAYLDAELRAINSLNAVPTAIASLCPLDCILPSAPVRSWRTPEARPDQAALVDAHSAFITAFWAYQKASVPIPSFPRSIAPRAAAKARLSHSTSIQVAPVPDIQINLSLCRTGQLRGHTYVDVNDLPLPLPSAMKVYSVRDRFQGVRTSDPKLSALPSSLNSPMGIPLPLEEGCPTHLINE